MKQYNNILYYVVTFLCLLTVDGAEYRFDYPYVPKADGWLKFHHPPATFKDAFLRCKAEGALLASPLTEDLRQVMISIFQSNSDACAIFTGIHATFSKGDFASVEGVPLSRIPVVWGPNEPNNYYGDEYCTAMLINGTLADVRCNEIYPYICYKEKTSSPVWSTCGTVDTDYSYEPRTGSCYKFHRFGLSWRLAYMTCVAEGGHLAIINGNTEAQVIREIFAKHPTSKIIAKYQDIAAVGNYAPADNSYWLTIHGQTLDEAGYAEFASGGPNNSTVFPGGQYCGSVFRDAKLNDFWCDGVTLPFICEKKPASLLND